MARVSRTGTDATAAVASSMFCDSVCDMIFCAYDGAGWTRSRTRNATVAGGRMNE